MYIVHHRTACSVAQLSYVASAAVGAHETHGVFRRDTLCELSVYSRVRGGGASPPVTRRQSSTSHTRHARRCAAYCAERSCLAAVAPQWGTTFRSPWAVALLQNVIGWGAVLVRILQSHRSGLLCKGRFSCPDHDRSGSGFKLGVFPYAGVAFEGVYRAP